MKKLKRKLKDYKVLKKQAMKLYEENERLKLELELLRAQALAPLRRVPGAAAGAMY